MNQLKTITNVLEGISTFREIVPQSVIIDKTLIQRQSEIKEALDEFMECVRYLNTRRTKGTVLSLSSEDNVQDALYLMLRPWIKDLSYEDPSAKLGNRYVINDFFIPSAETVIEAKYVRDKRHGKDISKEIHDDIEMYKEIAGCSLIIFFIYDPNGHIPSVKNLKQAICIPRTYNGFSFTVDLVIKP